jgi:hypothetical protein
VDSAITVGVGLASAVVGALAAGGVQIWQAAKERKRRRKIAALVVVRDIMVGEKAFRDLAQKRRWWDQENRFDQALETWREHRGDLAAEVEFWEFAIVDAFYGSLAEMSAIAHPGCPTSTQDVSSADEHASRASLSFMIAQRLVADDDEWEGITAQLAEAGMPIDPRDG